MEQKKGIYTSLSSESSNNQNIFHKANNSNKSDDYCDENASMDKTSDFSFLHSVAPIIIRKSIHNNLIRSTKHSDYNYIDNYESVPNDRDNTIIENYPKANCIFNETYKELDSAKQNPTSHTNGIKGESNSSKLIVSGKETIKPDVPSENQVQPTYIDAYGNPDIFSLNKEFRLSCDSNGFVSDDSLSFSNCSTNDALTPDIIQNRENTNEQPSTINVREMANFLERTDSFIRMLESKEIKVDNNMPKEVTSIPYPSRQVDEAKYWNPSCSLSQSKSFKCKKNEDDYLQRIEQSIELRNENLQLKERILELQSRLEKSERENLQLHEQISHLKSRYQDDDYKSQDSIYSILSPSTYHYSQTSLIKILRTLGIPKEVIKSVTIQIELEYQRNEINDILTAALAYSFDQMMHAFIRNDTEFATPLIEWNHIENYQYEQLPCYSDEFKDFIDFLFQPHYMSFYNQIKDFCINFWITLYNKTLIPSNTELHELIRNFCNSIEKELNTVIGKDITCEIDTSEIKEGMEQLLTNILGGGILLNLIHEKENYTKILNKRILIFQFVKPEHLDIKSIYTSNPLFLKAVKQLQCMLLCRSPRYMLQCLAETTKLLFSILGEEHSSADDFLPLFIYCTLQSRVLYLNVISDYINYYRNPKELMMGDGYILVNLISAIQFISSMDANCLTINPIDYRILYSTSEEQLREDNTDSFNLFFPLC